MIRLIFLFVVFYIVFKVVKVFSKIFFTGQSKPAYRASNPADNHSNTSGVSKYKDAEEVEYKEFKNDN